MALPHSLIAAVASKETLFALSLFPYLGFLWFITKSHQTPKLALAGFYFLLVFVVVTIPAGLYAEQHYHLELANVDWLHGWAESLLSVSNIMVVIGFTLAITNLKKTTSTINSEINSNINSNNQLKKEERA